MSQLILVAPAAFKGTLGPRQVADALAVGARRALPDAAVLQCPISDGGDGLLDAVLAPAALRERLSVTGPLGEPVSGELGWVDHETAIFESATACEDRKSTRLNSSHLVISYAVFCLKKKKKKTEK